MAIPDEEVARVRAATDIVGLIGEHVGLKRQGRQFAGLCPFHQEKTPSFYVNAEKGVYYCQGCQASGDAITFVRETQHVDFAEAVRILGDRAGIVVREDAAAAAEHRKRAPIYKVVSDAVDWYHERLLQAPDAGRARDYLRSRGFGGDVVRQFRLGWAPDEWDALTRDLGADVKLLERAGLGYVNRAGRQQDAFRARVLFPIFDPSGRALAIGGRVLPSAPGAPPGVPKYKNSPETAIYSKRRVLYGLNWAKVDIVASGEAIVCEGYTDVIGFFQAGLPRAVATCGTALAEEHFRLLRNFAGGRVVLSYDADAAGQTGASRVYEWERQHQVDVAVAALPAGSDPAELARTDPDALRASVEEARPFLSFRLTRIFGEADMTNAEGRAKAADAALTAILEHPNKLVRDQYLMETSDRCRLEPMALRARADELAKSASRSRHGERDAVVLGVGRGNGSSARGDSSGRPQRRRQPGPPDPRHSSRFGVAEVGDGPGADPPARSSVAQGAPSRSEHEMPAARDRTTTRLGAGARSRGADSTRPGLEALRLAVHDPDRIGERLERFLFVDDLQARAFDALAAADGVTRAIDLVDEKDPEVATLLRRLAVEEPAADADDCVVQLVRAASRRWIVTLEAEARLSPARVPEVAEEAAEVARDLELIGTSEAGLQAVDRLLAWLGRRESGA